MTKIRISFAVALAAAAVALALPRFAPAGETTREASWLSAASKVKFEASDVALSAPATSVYAWPFRVPGQLYDLVCTQITAGTGGTSLTVDVQKNGTTMLTTTANFLIGAGANKSVDARKEIAAVASTTRPVLKPQGSAIRVVKGDLISIVTSETGTYSPHPTYNCIAVFLPDN